MEKPLISLESARGPEMPIPNFDDGNLSWHDWITVDWDVMHQPKQTP